MELNITASLKRLMTDETFSHDLQTSAEALCRNRPCVMFSKSNCHFCTKLEVLLTKLDVNAVV
jgi:hypothetical protein